MRNWITLLALVCTAALMLPGLSQAQPAAGLHTPKAGSAEHAAIMDAMRPALSKGQRKRLVFVVRRLRVEDGWAYFSGTAQYADGTRLGPQYVWGNLSALLRRQNGTWKMKYSVYHGDVIEPEFIQKFPQAPKAIFQG